MFRFLILFSAILLCVDCTDVHAQQYRHQGHVRWWQPQSSRLGFSIGARTTGRDNYRDVGGIGFGNPNAYPFYGYGYVYDPYQTGSFRAPDLMDDPYFRAQHKYDSHFPGRYSRRPSLQLRQSHPGATYQPSTDAAGYQGH